VQHKFHHISINVLHKLCSSPCHFLCRDLNSVLDSSLCKWGIIRIPCYIFIKFNIYSVLGIQKDLHWAKSCVKVYYYNKDYPIMSICTLQHVQGNNFTFFWPLEKFHNSIKWSFKIQTCWKIYFCTLECMHLQWKVQERNSKRNKFKHLVFLQVNLHKFQ